MDHLILCTGNTRLSSSPEYAVQVQPELATLWAPYNAPGPHDPVYDDASAYVPIIRIDTAAGVGAVAGHEHVTGLARFSVAWLRMHGLIANRCRVMRVTGDSMEPTLPNGCMVLVNLHATQRKDGKVFVIRQDDELIIKRAADGGSTGWLLVSDNPDKQAWPNVPWPTDASVVGEVRSLSQTFA